MASIIRCNIDIKKTAGGAGYLPGLPTNRDPSVSKYAKPTDGVDYITSCSIPLPSIETDSESPPFPDFIFKFKNYCQSLHDELHAGDRHTVPQRFVAGRIGSGWDVCPPVRKTLQALALKGRQAANQIDPMHYTLIVVDILVVDALMV